MAELDDTNLVGADPGGVSDGLLELAGRIRDAVVASGWTERHPGEPTVAAFTHPTTGGLLATAQLDRAPGQPQDWPVAVHVGLGVAHGPALDLGVLLALPDGGRTRLALVDAPTPPTSPSGDTVITIPTPAGIVVAADQITALITGPAIASADSVGGVDDLIAALRDGAPTGDGTAGGSHDGVVNHSMTVRVPTDLVVLLAAVGRDTDVDDLLAPARTAADHGTLPRAGRRFLRQLSRWQTAGRPPAPPLEDTLTRLPPHRPRSAASLADTRAAAGRRRDALTAAEARSPGKTTGQVADLITAECDSRHVTITAAALAEAARKIHTRQQPFGRVRWAGHSVRTATAVIGFFRHRTVEDPLWLRAPDRASYPATDPFDPLEPVDLDDAAAGWLTAAHAGAADRIGDRAAVEVWLTTRVDEADAAAVIVHLGDRRVGTLDPAPTARLHRVLDNAAFFDEDPLTSGELTHTVDGRWCLDIHLPDDPDPRAGDGSGSGS